MKKEEIIKIVAKEAEKGIDIYADYRDSLEDKNFKELLSRIEDSPNEKPLWIFQDYISELYEDYFLYNDEKEEVKYLLSNEGIDFDDLDEKVQEEVMDTFRENVVYNPPFDHYLGQKICVNIVVDCGDANYDFGINEVYPHYDGDYDTLKKFGVPKESCISWLAKRQGYKQMELRKALLHDKKVESKFLQSVYAELLNTSSALPSLVFMKSMTVEEWLELLEKRYIQISKDTRTGLVDFWNGAGGLLEIELEKDFKFDKKFVYEIRPDCTYRYGVLNIYGACESLYD